MRGKMVGVARIELATPRPAAPRIATGNVPTATFSQLLASDKILSGRLEMAAWTRSKSKLTKIRVFDEGELNALLVAGSSPGDADFDERAYQGLLIERADWRKANSFALVAASLGVLAYFRMLSGVSAAGLGVLPTGFSHIALVLLGFAGFWCAASYARLAFSKSWFQWKFKCADASARAILLFRYPQAFGMFKFIPEERGYPRYVTPYRFWYVAAFFMLLSALALLAGAFGLLKLWCGLAADVWRSALPSQAFAGLTIAVSALFWLLAILLLISRRDREHYLHRGLLTLLGRIKERNPTRGAHFGDKIVKLTGADGEAARRLADAEANTAAALKKWGENGGRGKD